MKVKTEQLDAVSAALNVEIPEDVRAQAQIQDEPAAPEPEPDPAAEPAAPAAPAAPDDQAAAPAPAAKPTKDGEAPAPDDELTPERIQAALEGKPVAKDGEQAPEDQGTGDPLLDEPIDDSIKGHTRKRMEKLLAYGRESHERVQELSSRVEELEPLAQQAEGWHNVVVRSGLTPEDFATVMGTMASINVGTPDQKRNALKMIDQLRSRVARDLGEEVEGVDLLADHPDLRQQVDRLEITRSAALELARAREERARGEQQQARLVAQQRAKQERDEAAARLDELGAQLEQRDGAAFHVRRHIALSTLRGAVANLPPSQWEETFLNAYNSVPAYVVEQTLNTLRGQQQPAPRRHTPVMRSGVGGGTGGPGGNGGQPRATPRTAQDAVFAALNLPAPTDGA